jgi:hypothetical protein
MSDLVYGAIVIGIFLWGLSLLGLPWWLIFFL